MTPEQVRGSRDSVTVRLYDDDDDDDGGNGGGSGVSGYKFFTKECSSNLSLIASVFTAERMINKSRTVYSGERTLHNLIVSALRSSFLLHFYLFSYKILLLHIAY